MQGLPQSLGSSVAGLAKFNADRQLMKELSNISKISSGVG